MDADSQKELQRILLLSDGELTQDDINFLVARRSYLTKSQREDYADFLPKDDGVEAQQPASTPRVNPFKNNPQPTQYQDKDVRLNLDNAAAPIEVPQPEPAQPVVEEVVAQPEVQPELVVEPAQPEVVAENPSVVEEQAPCLDPDCTHENHQ